APARPTLPSPPPEPPAPAPPLAPEPATSTTMRLPPVMPTLEGQSPRVATHGLTDRLVWALVLTLGLMLMLGAAAYALILLRG
ncbi:MAG: hypothetical protein WCJ55_11065, partial [Chloroflexales bacterium]